MQPREHASEVSHAAQLQPEGSGPVRSSQAAAALTSEKLVSSLKILIFLKGIEGFYCSPSNFLSETQENKLKKLALVNLIPLKCQVYFDS